MTFDPWASLIVLITAGALCLWYFIFGRPKRPLLYLSTVKGLEACPFSWKNTFKDSPEWLLWSSAFFLLVAFADPHSEASLEGELETLPPSQGIAIYLLLDQSGSMEGTISIPSRELGIVETTKLSFLKEMTSRFIKERTQDLIGIVAFARTAQVLSPLTLDHQKLLEILNKLDIMRIKDQNGTGIGYAVFKTAQLITATRHFSEKRQKEGKTGYSIKNAIIILVTDGFQDPNPLDTGSQWRTMTLEEMGKSIAGMGIKVYVVNMEPKFTQEKFAPQRHELENAVKMTGGRLFITEEVEKLPEIYQEIDAIEKSPLPVVEFRQPTKIRYAAWPIAIALCCIALSISLESLWLQRIP